MADVFSPEKRSDIMRQVRHRDTTPERLVRSIIHKMGYRFSLRRKDLPGKPDIALVSRLVIIFVHGCFWHSHPGCPRATVPATNAKFWREKLARNCERDRQNATKLRRLGWKVLVIWECELKDQKKIGKKIKNFITKQLRPATY